MKRNGKIRSRLSHFCLLLSLVGCAGNADTQQETTSVESLADKAPAAPVKVPEGVQLLETEPGLSAVEVSERVNAAAARQKSFNVVCASGAFALQSTDSGDFATVRVDYGGSYYGMLRAVGAMDDWEKLLVCGDGQGGVFFFSIQSQLWVSAELGYATNDYRYGMLRGRASTPDIWERFAWVFGGAGFKSLENNKYVSARFDLSHTSPDDYGMLRASESIFDVWEGFTLVPY